jgi:PhnB protein
MTSRLNPYLNFNGNARAAMEFYRDVFGGELAVTMFADFGMEGPDAERVMHSQLESEAGYTLMAADVMSTMEYQPMAGASVSISGDDSEVLHRYFEQLADGGTVTMPMAKQAWGDEFGMCVDRYGVPWLVNIGQA